MAVASRFLLRDNLVRWLTTAPGNGSCAHRTFRASYALGTLLRCAFLVGPLPAALLLPSAVSADLFRYSIGLECTSDEIALVSMGILVDVSATSVTFGPGCTETGCFAAIGLGPTVDPALSTAAGPGLLFPPGVRSDTLYFQVRGNGPSDRLCTTFQTVVLGEFEMEITSEVPPIFTTDGVFELYGVDSFIDPFGAIVTSGTATSEPAAPEDTDGDGVQDDSDNCVYTHNPGQEDSGGFSTEPDGVGDACQCGDVDDNGGIDGDDLTKMRQYLVGAGGAAGFVLEKCSVFGATECDIADAFALGRALQLLPPSVQQVCTAASAP